jgi:drug/metabolite transporter (DMT)-like permease
MVGIGGGGGGNYSPFIIGLAFTIYGSLNLFLNFFNKWALKSDGGNFTYPVFYSMCHMITSLCGSWLLMFAKKPATGMPTFEQFNFYKWEALSLSLCTTVNITCNNASLMIIGLFVNQIIKALAPLLSMIFSAIILKRTYEKKIIASVVVIAIAAGFAVPFKDPSVTVLGVLFVSVATFASSAKPVVGELLMSVSDKPKLAPAALVFYDSCFSAVFMLIYWLSVPSEREGSLTYLATNPAEGWAIIILGSLAAFGYNMSVFYFTMVASAVAVMVATNLLKVVLITVSAILENVRDPLNWGGIIVFFIAVVWYAYLSFEAKMKKSAPATTAPSEKTPLK